MTTARTTGPIPTWIPVPATDTTARAAVHGVMEAPAESRARCAVLLVPPVGREQVSSLRALIALSHELAQRGAMVLRIALRGTADSHPVQDDIRQAWADDIAAALAELARRAPGVPQRALGLRIGAAVLGAQSQQVAESVDRCILWEPVGGRAYLRKAAALRRMSIKNDVVDPAMGTETAGELYVPAQATDLKALKLPGADALPEGWSVRSEENPDVAELLYEASFEFARVPRRAVREIAHDLTRSGSTTDQPVDLQPLKTMALEYRGKTVTEHLIRTEGGSPGILVTPGDADAPDAVLQARGPAVFMVSAAAEPMDGPTGLWTTVGRDLAAAGLTVLRTDRPRCGILTDPLDDAPPIPYEQAAIDAVAADARWLRRVAGRPVTGVGMCVGSWLLMRAGRAGNLSRVIAFNNIAWRTGIAYYQRIYGAIALWEGAPAALLSGSSSDSLPLTQPRGSMRLRTVATTVLYGTRRRLKSALSATKDMLEDKSPAPVWHVLGRTGLVDAPSTLLTHPDLPPALDLIQGREDMERFQYLHGDWAVRHAQSARGLRQRRQRVTQSDTDEILLTPADQKSAWPRGKKVIVRSVPELDHALLSASGRVMARSILLELLVGADSAFGVAAHSIHEQSWITGNAPPQPDTGEAGARTTMI
ncbi:MAG: hypothetical protein Q4C81_07950 [Kocuria sp.]|nr:hypothetical protein [Kocuria sp.]